MILAREPEECDERVVFVPSPLFEPYLLCFSLLLLNESIWFLLVLLAPYIGLAVKFDLSNAHRTCPR